MLTSHVARERLADRLDPAYYSPLSLRADDWLKSLHTIRLGDVAQIKASAFYEGIAERYAAEGVPLARVGDVKKGTFDSMGAVKLQPEVANRTPGLTAVPPPLILITKGGSVGRVGVAAGGNLLALSRDVIGVLVNETEDVGFILFFLASVPGSVQVLRGASRQVQAHLTLERLAATRLVHLSTADKVKLQEALDQLIEEKNAFDQARRALAEALAKIDPFSRLEDHFLAFKLPRGDNLRIRLDPSYYRPGFADARKRALAEGWRALGDIPALQFGVSRWERDSVPADEEIAYVPLAAVEAETGRIVGTVPLRAWEAPGRAKWRTTVNDVLVPYLLGSLNRVGLVEGVMNELVCSSGFHVIRSESLEESLFVAAYLSSEGARKQIAREGTGAVMQSVSEDLLREVLVPPPTLLGTVPELFSQLRSASRKHDVAWSSGIELLHKLIGWEGPTETDLLRCAGAETAVDNASQD